MALEDRLTRIQEKFVALRGVLDERGRRLWAATEVTALGHGGQTVIAKATGLSRRTIYQGVRELAQSGGSGPDTTGRVRSPGGGRKPLPHHDSRLWADLAALVEPTSRGDRPSPLRWTCKSVRQLAAELQRQGHQVGRQKVAALLADLGYSLQAHRKTKEGTSHPDRHAQFAYINAQVATFQKRGQPVVSVDTKKKEWVGDFRNAGREWRPKGVPEPVGTHDFADTTLGQVNPYGVYDQTANVGWGSIGVDHDTATFAVESIRRWWINMGARCYRGATELWKVARQQLADETGLRLSVCHFPPGTSKWNKIEHRMFSYISMNWRGRPLTSHEVIVNLIANTTTAKGLRIQAQLDTGRYPTGLKVTDQELRNVAVEPATFHGEWNYTITPRRTQA